ncbi:unnamed protein product, partial [Ectocarpus sp. 12 AP-2014]
MTQIFVSPVQSFLSSFRVNAYLRVLPFSRSLTARTLKISTRRNNSPPRNYRCPIRGNTFHSTWLNFDEGSTRQFLPNCTVELQQLLVTKPKGQTQTSPIRSHKNQPSR